MLTVHRALPTEPLPSRSLRRLERELWKTNDAVADGLHRCRPEPLLVYLSVQVARETIRSPAQLTELRVLAEHVTQWTMVWELATAVGVADTLRSVLGRRGPAAAQGDAKPAESMRRLAWRATRVLRATHRAATVRDALLGEPWHKALTRCRFAGLELLTGPGVFLPRRVSEPAVDIAAQRLADADRPVVVDVGTGCGAIALAIAKRLPQARVLGFDVDNAAVRWAGRNARRLRLERVQFARGSLLESLPRDVRGLVSLVTANVPCVPPEDFAYASDAPRHAYMGVDPDGLGLQRRLAEQALEVLCPGGSLLVQLGPSQSTAYEQFLQELDYETEPPRGDGVAIIGIARAPAR